MKYKKKPVVIEAIQWTGNTSEIIQFCGDNCSYNVEDTAWQVGKGIPHEELIIHTLEGDMKASRNDYIIKGINGEFYPCKPDIFEKTYERVADITEINISIGNKVKVKDNLLDELRRLTFDEETCEGMAERFVGTEQEVLALWINDDGQEYATVDLCCEIPLQCLEVVC